MPVSKKLQHHEVPEEELVQDDYETGEEMVPEYLDDDVKTFLSWHAHGRPYQEHSVEYYTNSFLITMAIEIILFLFSQYVLMALVFSLAFLVFALSIVPPRNLYYRISSEGIRVEDHYFIWEELYDFYFTKSHGQDLLHVRTKDYFPGELTIVLGDVPIQQIKSVLIYFLPFREYVKPSFMDKAGDWLTKNFPLERTSGQ
jgi:hypothetical protein